MNRLCIFFSILISCAFLLGCGPVYKTEYSYVPPRSTVGTMCISQCVQNKNVCEQMCQMRNQNCRAQARQEAYYRYDEYKQDRYNKGKKVKKNVDYFDNSSNCDQACDCNSAFNMCYSACGGQVVQNKVCVAFCDKQ